MSDSTSQPIRLDAFARCTVPEITDRMFMALAKGQVLPLCERPEAFLLTLDLNGRPMATVRLVTVEGNMALEVMAVHADD
ncbi:FliM/FliN family flagellar motor C-terminal domain-containing protein [Roseobacter weihaiensis]|uniref:FliM/FliN family flagellar motor C-terminal domain-containing protein n=1 Tax=Roseobacter weihaiensis TaxID=2763262 RepID=UPI001D0B1E36|nr:FliM/FliN family flagellar motor C-terminal domain-containing protein [Roseobacter sp. H9]